MFSRAADWKLEFPDWKGRMRIVTLGEKCIIRLEDSNNGLSKLLSLSCDLHRLEV